MQPFLDVRVAVLNKTLAGSFRRLYPDFQPDNENCPARLSAEEPTTLHALVVEGEKDAGIGKHRLIGRHGHAAALWTPRFRRLARGFSRRVLAYLRCAQQHSMNWAAADRARS